MTDKVLKQIWFFSWTKFQIWSKKGKGENFLHERHNFRQKHFPKSEKHFCPNPKFLIQIWVVTIEDLPLYLYQRSMSSIVDREQNGGGWRPEWDDAIKTHPEAYNVKYDIVVNSKAYFLHNASVGF